MHNVIYFISLLFAMVYLTCGAEASDVRLGQENRIKMVINEFESGTVKQTGVLTDLLIDIFDNRQYVYSGIQIVASNNVIKTVISRYQSELEAGKTPKPNDFNLTEIGADFVLIPKIDRFGEIYILTATVLELKTFETVGRRVVQHKATAEMLPEILIVFASEIDRDLSNNIVSFTIVPPFNTKIVKRANYYITCGDTTVKLAYVVNDKHYLAYYMDNMTDDDFLNGRCLNPNGKYDVSYRVEWVYKPWLDGQAVTAIGKIVKPLHKNVGNFNMHNPSSLGMYQFVVDADELFSLKKAAKRPFNHNDYPEYIKGEIVYGKNKYRFKFADDSDKGAVFYMNPDDKPITLKLEAYGYQSKPYMRQYVYYSTDFKGQEEIFLNKDSFK